MHVIAAPDVAAKIMVDDGANARHRLYACKVLNDFAANGPEAAPALDRIQIILNLTGDGGNVVERYDLPRAITINPDDTDTGTAPAIAAITTKNREEDDGGEHL